MIHRFRLLDRAAFGSLIGPLSLTLFLLAVAVRPATAGSWVISSPTYSCSFAQSGSVTGHMTASNKADCGGMGNGNGRLTGTATINVAWIPAFPHEPVPNSAVVTETISLGSAIYTAPGSTIPTTDTGLAGNVTKRYSIKTGSSFPLTSPNILAKLTAKPGMNFGGSLSFTYTVMVDNVKVKLVGYTDDNGDFKVLAGQQITATLSYGANGYSSNYNWVTTGTVFEDYQSDTVGKVLPLTSSDTIYPSLDFYTLKGNEPIKVTCTAQYFPPGDGVLSGSAMLSGESPVVTSEKPVFAITDWQTTSGKIQQPSPQQFGLYSFPYGTGNGQLWTANVSLPSPFTGSDGSWCFSQLINSSTTAYTRGLANNVWVPARNGTPPVKQITGEALDNTFTYLSKTSPLGSPLTTGDSPGMTFPSVISAAPVIKVNRDDSFRTWIMYKPPSVAGQSTTWIPLAYYTWSWGGTVEYVVGTGYVMTRPSPNPANPTVSGIQVTDNHPTWSQVFKNIGSGEGTWVNP